MPHARPGGDRGGKVPPRRQGGGAGRRRLLAQATTPGAPGPALPEMEAPGDRALPLRRRRRHPRRPGREHRPPHPGRLRRLRDRLTRPAPARHAPRVSRVWRFLQVDVFTDRPLAGNQLAVVLDARGLADAEMQAIAREMNLAETTFVLPATQVECVARVPIFTPARELPFAGHPTPGTAGALALGGQLPAHPPVSS